MTILKTLANGMNDSPSGIPTPVSNTPVTSDFVFDLAVDNADTALVDTDVIEAMWLPKNCVLVPGLVYIASDELDDGTTPLLTLEVGCSVAGVLDIDAIIDGFATGATWQLQNGIDNVGDAGGAFEALGYSASDRKVIITCTGVNDGTAVAGKLHLTIGYRNKRQGDVNTD